MWELLRLSEGHSTRLDVSLHLLSELLNLRRAKTVPEIKQASVRC